LIEVHDLRSHNLVGYFDQISDAVDWIRAQRQWREPSEFAIGRELPDGGYERLLAGAQVANAVSGGIRLPTRGQLVVFRPHRDAPTYRPPVRLRGGEARPQETSGQRYEPVRLAAGR
jgi:hypothetical protein